MDLQFAAKDYASILDNLYDGMYIVDRNRVIQYWNKAAEQITGYTAEEVIGKSCSANILTHVDNKGCNLCKGYCPLLKTMQSDGKNESTVYLHHKNGHRVPVAVRISTLHDDNGDVTGGIELFRQIKENDSVHVRIRELEELALIDNLTGVGNRHLIEQEMNARISEYQQLQVPFGIIFADIDHFKQFNDTYGHDVGDRVLRYVAATLSENLRAFDFIGRWGGEEMLCIMRNVQDAHLMQAAERLRMLVESCYLMDNNHKLQVTVSMGATMCNKNDTATTLIKRADELLYQSKTAGRNCVTTG